MHAAFGRAYATCKFSAPITSSQMSAVHTLHSKRTIKAGLGLGSVPFDACPFSVLDYLNFKVVNANKANTSDAIQKRTMIFDSDQPSSSK